MTDYNIDLILWISRADFLRLQQPEPIIGESVNYHAAADMLGIRGQSVYTALFHHEDMETFTCRLCGHVVMESLEDAVTHQRAHFHHHPYQCLGTHAKWYASFAPSF